jgi:hypothetical protein
MPDQFVEIVEYDPAWPGKFAGRWRGNSSRPGI